jgi:hypothetical protein
MHKIVPGVLILGSVLLLGALPHVGEAAFGISPPFMHADHLVPGSKFVQTIYLVQDQPVEDLRIKANLDIPEKVRSWISIDKGFEFTIPKGTRQFPVQVVVEVPKGTELAAYRGNLTFTGAPAQSGQVTIALGAQVSIDLRVGNDIFEKFSVPVIRLLDIEEGWNPRVYVKFNNEGNIPEAFTHATYELLDQYGAVRLAYIQKADDFPETPPFTIKEYSVEFPIDFHLGLGQYWGKVDFYQNEKVVASQKTVFNVLKAGSLSGPWSVVLDKIREYWIFGVIGLLALALVVVSVLKFRKK